ncbi:MAG: membrane dipeptidase [Planctomycetota bacterium]
MSAAALARSLVELHAVFDAHVDSIGRALDEGHDLGVRGPGQLDLERAREGGLGAAVFACWVDPARFLPGAFSRARAMLAALHALAARHPSRVRLVGNARALAAARAEGRLAAVAGVEGGHAIEEDLAKLDFLFAHGLRAMTLVWNNHLSWIRSCQDGAGEGVPAGLGAFGRRVVARMGELGVLADLSHASERAVFDVLEVAAHPPIASHSGCRALHDHPRNLSDEALRRIGARGGVVGIVFHPPFLAPAQEAPLPAARLLAHIAHAAEVAGAANVGLGSDFDGIERGPEGIEDASRYGALAELLLGHGFGAEETRGILGANFERVFAEATGPGTLAYAAEIRPLAAETVPDGEDAAR